MLLATFWLSEQVCPLSLACLDTASGLAAPHILSYVKATAGSAVLLCELPPETEAGSLGSMRLMMALLQSTTILMQAHSNHLDGDTQWPRVQLSLFGTFLSRITALFRVRLSAAVTQSRPVGFAPEEEEEEASAALAAQAASPARVVIGPLIGEGWRKALGVACSLAWKAMHIRHADESRAGGLQKMHLHSAYLLSLGLGEQGCSTLVNMERGRG